jgi:hypothetical protein
VLQKIKDWWKKTWVDIKFSMLVDMSVIDSPASLGLRPYSKKELKLIKTARKQSEGKK